MIIIRRKVLLGAAILAIVVFGVIWHARSGAYEIKNYPSSGKP
jgi:hypothetical protein